MPYIATGGVIKESGAGARSLCLVGAINSNGFKTLVSRGDSAHLIFF